MQCLRQSTRFVLASNARTAITRCRCASTAVKQTQSQPKTDETTTSLVLKQQDAAEEVKRVKQGVDYSTLVAACSEINKQWVPAKVEQVGILNKRSFTEIQIHAGGTHFTDFIFDHVQ